MIEDYSGKTAVLTGAASGLGLECARIAARLGMRLVLVDVQADALAAAEAEMKSLAADVLALRVDVSNAEEMDALGVAVRERFGAPHLVFNNAGVIATGLVWETSAREWDWVMGVNLRGVAHGVRVFTPMMLEAARADADWRGHIVNTSSMAGLLATPNMGVYNVSKHAVVALSETLYQDLQLVTGQIGASVLCPYFVPTGIARSERNRPDELNVSGATRSQQLGSQMLDKAVTHSRVTAEEVAQKVFDAVAANQFYIYSHPQAVGAVRTRMDDILQARNPSDPFAARPQLREQLQDQLMGRWPEPPASPSEAPA
ncbi:SDR family oxidoreductase [Diaphorobacter aerolatus]|uniref:SDR family oxidoreductase n=1 Tax=Diaphorobacter aerolatus TaxID=1288495 RepID=A0A7H0GJM3_9BURK|nr:SDR family oxidoreductase [Diaphorobacter aerolatus]QNP48489.1 SDR family oxidoreductase [Diaphorobacter aerolatus]